MAVEFVKNTISATDSLAYYSVAQSSRIPRFKESRHACEKPCSLTPQN